MNICAIIVVFDYNKESLNTIISRLFEMNIDRIILIDNGNYNLDFSLDEMITVITSGKNLGAVGGFSLGMKEALKSECDYFWLLDEDNYPEPKALLEIGRHWKKLIRTNKEDKLMVYSYRPQLFKHLHISRSKGVASIGPLKNSYLGFHYLQVFKFITTRIRKKASHLPSKTTKLIRMDTGYFGGLFFHRSVIDKGFLPDERFSIYWGDLDFTRRFHLSGGQIYLAGNSIIEDIDDEEENKQKHNFFYHPILDMTPSFRAFDYIRSLILYQAEMNEPNLSYFINKVIMLSLIGISALFRNKLSRLRLLSKAISSTKREV